MGGNVNVVIVFVEEYKVVDYYEIVGLEDFGLLECLYEVVGIFLVVYDLDVGG